ncbi:MAG: suppressor of fused domain protein [Planctomycetota bacterium]
MSEEDPGDSEPEGLVEPADEEPSEVTPGGSRVYHYGSRTVPEHEAHGDAEHIDRISAHIEQHLGKVDLVFHELVSDLVHIDVHLVRASDERPFHTLVTSGMSEVPMHGRGPEGAFKAWAELCVSLPSEWPLEQEAFRDEAVFWPLRWLKRLARFPHEYDTWLGWGHTLPNGDPPEPLGPGTDFVGWLVLPPLDAPAEFLSLDIGHGRQVDFFAIYPLYAEEMELKLERGTDALLDLFAQHDVSDVIQVGRPNVAR